MVLPVMPLIGIAASLAAEFAPGLVRKLAGDKAWEVAEKIVGTAKAITGTADPEAALAALREDAKAQAEFKRRMAELEIELEKAYLADRQNARLRDVELRKAGYRNTRADMMLLMAFLCLVAIVYFTWSGRLDMPDNVFALLNMAAGMILKMIGDAFQFEFGSSRGSKEKDILMRK